LPARLRSNEPPNENAPAAERTDALAELKSTTLASAVIVAVGSL
jgi:hypothetical protein